MESKRPIYEGLNGLRGVAAVCVMLFHAEGLLGFQLMPHGYLAVDLFFVLSGFVIAHAYDAKFASGLPPFAFFWLRLKRFYPLYFLGLIISAGWVAIELILSPPAVLSFNEWGIALAFGSAFLPAPVAADLYPFNPPAWSLLIELLINLVYALALTRLSIRALALTAAIFLVALVVSTGTGPIDGGARFADFHVGVLRAAWSFPIGVLIYRLKDKIRLPQLNPLLIIAAASVTMAVNFLDLLIVSVVFPLLIALLAASNARRHSAFLSWLGAISFPLYAIHFPIIQIGLAFTSWGNLAVGIGTLISAIVLAHLAQMFLDSPLQRRLSARRIEAAPDA